MDDDDRKPAAKAADGELEEGNKVKPALKNGRTSKKRDKHLEWDEHAIEEHNKLRGTRMTIEEPKTPYVYYDSGAESDDSRRMKSPAGNREAISWDNLQNRLDSVAAVQEQYPSSQSEHTDADHSDRVDENKDEMRKLEFEEHRKRHYNEFELVKKFRMQHDDDDEDDDVDNGNHENK